MKQPSFADLAYDNKKKITLKERFFGEMVAVLPWSILLKPIKPQYPQLPRGRAPVPVKTLLRVYLMQQWYPLSYPAMGAAVMILSRCAELD